MRFVTLTSHASPAAPIDTAACLATLIPPDRPGMEGLVGTVRIAATGEGVNAVLLRSTGGRWRVVRGAQTERREATSLASASGDSTPELRLQSISSQEGDMLLVTSGVPGLADSAIELIVANAATGCGDVAEMALTTFSMLQDLSGRDQSGAGVVLSTAVSAR